MTAITWPWLPLELLERIISEAWSSPLSIEERITFITTSTLVNLAWLSAFATVSSRDVYIPSASYADHFMRQMFKADRMYKKYDLGNPELHCQSLSFTLRSYSRPKIVRDIRVHAAREEALGTGLSTTLADLRTTGCLPNLRRVAIEYIDWGTEDIFTNFRFSHFPTQVTELYLNFTRNWNGTEKTKKSTTADYWRQERVLWIMPSIRHLTVVGASAAFVADMLATCPNLETLAVDGGIRMLSGCTLPHSVHTLTLRAPSNDHRKGSIEELVAGIMAGMLRAEPLSKGTSKRKLRVVVEWGRIEKSVWGFLDSLAKDCGVSLSHLVID